MKCCYGVVRSELKRYAKLSSNFSDYWSRKKLLFSKLMDKGYIHDKLNKIYNSIKFH